MEIKLFGKSIFNYKSAKAESIWGGPLVSSETKQSKFLPDFYKIRGNSGESSFSDYAILQATSNSAIAVPIDSKKAEPQIKVDGPTPKKVFELKLLNDDSFKINTDPKYVDQQISDFKDKLKMISDEEYDMRNGVKEIDSIKMRMENRKKYPEFKEFFEGFAYTTTTKINKVLKDQSHLQMGQIAQFLADMPGEAVKAMKDYSAKTKKLCDKDAVYYIIADKKDFKKSDTRRDPILLAQSPFGHFWQIIGAWDEEMLFLEQL